MNSHRRTNNFQHHHPKWINGMMELAGIHVCGVGWDESEEVLYSQAPSRPEARAHRYGWTDEPDPGGRPERVLDGGRPRNVSDWILTSRLSISRCSRCTFRIASTPVSGQLNRFTCVFFTCFIDRLSFCLPAYLIPTSRPNARRVRTVRKESPRQLALGPSRGPYALEEFGGLVSVDGE